MVQTTHSANPAFTGLLHHVGQSNKSVGLRRYGTVTASRGLERGHRDRGPRSRRTIVTLGRSLCIYSGVIELLHRSFATRCNSQSPSGRTRVARTLFHLSLYSRWSIDPHPADHVQRGRVQSSLIRLFIFQHRSLRLKVD